jgi:hypothetical protein
MMIYALLNVDEWYNVTVDLIRYKDDAILQTLMHYDCDYLSICSLFIYLFFYQL